MVIVPRFTSPIVFDRFWVGNESPGRSERGGDSPDGALFGCTLCKSAQQLRVVAKTLTRCALVNARHREWDTLHLQKLGEKAASRIKDKAR